MLPPSFFDHFEDWLNLAVYDTNQEYQMNEAAIKAALADIPDIDKLSTSIGHTKRFLHFPNGTVEVPISATADEIRTALQDNFGKKPMSITGLKTGAFKAMLEEMKAELGGLQSQGMDDVKTATAEAKAEIKATVDNVKAKIKSEVADALQDFSEYTNGGPA